MPEESLHKKYFMEKHENDDRTNKRLIDLIKEESDILYNVSELHNWKMVEEQRREYLRLSDIYDIHIYDSVEDALISSFKK